MSPAGVCERDEPDIPFSTAKIETHTRRSLAVLKSGMPNLGLRLKRFVLFFGPASVMLGNTGQRRVLMQERLYASVADHLDPAERRRRWVQSGRELGAHRG